MARPSPTEGQLRSQRRGRPTGRIVAAALVGAAAAVLVLENSAEVRIRLFVPVVTMPLWLALALLYVAGLATGWLMMRRR